MKLFKKNAQTKEKTTVIKYDDFLSKIKQK